VTTIALLTDFGTRDWYVAAMTGAILSVAGRADIIDISHSIPMGDIRAGAYALLASHRSFPRGTVFVAVVDPGVGSSRLALIARCGDSVLIGPDNGLLAPCLALEPRPVVRQISNPGYQRSGVSAVFHGRDVFAPAAAHMVRGVPFPSFGPLVVTWVTGPCAPAQYGRERAAGAVCYIDHLGNALTNIQTMAAQEACGKQMEVRTAGRCPPIVSYYEEVPRGKPLAVTGSSGYVEIAVNGGSACRRLGLRPGSVVTVTRTKKR